jgi:hypothetical protein
MVDFVLIERSYRSALHEIVPEVLFAATLAVMQVFLWFFRAGSTSQHVANALWMAPRLVSSQPRYG